MKITRVTTAVLEANFDWTIVKVETDERITGYGEAFAAPGLPAIIADFANILIGEDPSSIDRLVRRMRLSSIHAAPGAVAHAYLGIETALLDIIGKKHGMPVWQILGGKYRDSVRLYADCHAGDALHSINCLLVPRTPAWMGASTAQAVVSFKHHGWDASTPEHFDPEAFGARAQQMVQRGFRFLKFDVDVPSTMDYDEYSRGLTADEIDAAVQIAASVKKAVGRQARFALDCHWNYNVDSAVRLARALEPYDLLWLEDPVPPENVRSIREVQRSTSTTVATGENHYNRIDFERLIVDGGLRLLAPDVQKIGLWEGRKVADLADMHYVNLTLHNISGPIGTMAGVHLCAAVPNVLALEWHAASVPFFDELVKDRPASIIEHGAVEVPDEPGLGIDLDEDAAYKYRRAGLPFFGD